MEWKNFKESDKEYPEQIILKIIKGFENATKGLLTIQIVEQSELINQSFGIFQYRVLLTSTSLSSYRFEIFKIGYNIEIFPVNVRIEDSINLELTGLPQVLSDTLKPENEEKLEEVIIKIFATKRFEEIVAGLMKISKKY